MKQQQQLFSSVALLLAVTVAAASPIRDAACSQLQGALQAQLENTSITGVDHVAAGTNLTVPAGVLCPKSTVTLAAVCRVQATIHTSNSSETRIEVWLPDDWNGRFLGTGNGALNGCIMYSDLTVGSAQGFATVGSNAGHDGQTAEPLFHAPERIKDYVYRASVESAKVGKQVSQIYYGSNVLFSYFTGCSAGGRQAFKMIQDFPDLYDGLIGGCPAFDWNHYQGAGGQVARILQSTAGPGLLNADELKLVYQDTLAQCDGIDGMVDGIIDDPDHCAYRPERLLCVGEKTESCLNSTQVEATRRLFEPFYGTTGELLFPRLDPGMTGSPNDLLGPGVYTSTQGWFRYVIFNDPTYNFSTFSVADMEFANKVNPFNVSSYNFDIRPFIERGGRVLSYHGTQDQHFGSGNSRRYYNGVLSTLSLPTLDGFWRHFQVPGMQHCNGGPGAWAFGQSGIGFTAGIPNNTESNILLALVNWVEGGAAPDTIVGTKFVNDDPRKGVQAQRTHCRYPMRSKFNGVGDPKIATSWSCVAEDV